MTDDSTRNMQHSTRSPKIDHRTFEFALLVIEAYRYLIERKEFVLSKQLLRSGTSIGANVHEAQAAQSKKDFISKMAVASKEARETDYWLRLLDSSGYLADFDKKEVLYPEIGAVISVITKIVKTSAERYAR